MVPDMFSWGFSRECSRLGQPFFQLEPKRIFFKEIACLLALLFPRESAVFLINFCAPPLCIQVTASKLFFTGEIALTRQVSKGQLEKSRLSCYDAVWRVESGDY
jgi:hypothetical protein